MRKNIFVILSMILVLSMSISIGSFAKSAQASQEEYSLTRWSYTNSVSQNLNINSSGTATMTVSVFGYKGTTTKIKIVTDLLKYSGGTWKKVKTYMDTFNTWYGAKEHTYSGLDKGYTYRMKCTYTVYNGSNYEYFILYSNQESY